MRDQTTGSLNLYSYEPVVNLMFTARIHKRKGQNACVVGAVL